MLTAADARANTSSANYQAGYNSGRSQGQADVKANPGSYGLEAGGSYSNGYNAGYSAGKSYGAGTGNITISGNDDTKTMYLPSAGVYYFYFGSDGTHNLSSYTVPNGRWNGLAERSGDNNSNWYYIGRIIANGAQTVTVHFNTWSHPTFGACWH